MSNELQSRSFNWRREAAIALLLTALAFVVRFDRVGFNSLSEDEVAKWQAVQQYRNGHFAGVNSEHPMVMKVLAWASLTIGERWSRVASPHGWPLLDHEGWLRLPNILFGAATAALLYLFCLRLMGSVGAFAAGFFWAVAPLPVALNRLTKEETPVTFFTLLACYLYCRAKQADQASTRRWYDLSAIAFGLAFASQYILHLFGMNGLAWHLAGRNGLDRKPLASNHRRLFVVILLTLAVINPVILSPANFISITHWLHHDGVKHSGYAFNGTLYLNFPSRLLSGVPWYFYLLLLFVKTPIPILVLMVLGSILLLRNRNTLASCFFLSFGALQLIALSVCGAKWIRYSLPVLPFLFLAAGYAVQLTWKQMRERNASAALVGITAVFVFGWPLLEVHAWAPYYSFYLNSFGGGRTNVARYFAPDEVSEFDTREVAQQVCGTAPAATRLATARPMSMAHYLEGCGREDIQVTALYDPGYAPREGDLIVLEPSRRFVETQRYFDLLQKSGMARREVRVGPVLASTIYSFDSSGIVQKATGEHLAAVRSLEPQPGFGTNGPTRDWASTHNRLEAVR